MSVPSAWTTACPDWKERILKGRSLIPSPPIFPGEAKAAIDVFNTLRLVDVVGTPTMGEACRPWIVGFVETIFGAYDADTGKRLINEFFLLISKKNGKSTTAAGIMLTALVRNWRESAEFLILAPTIEIANNSFVPARDMVRKDPNLEKLFHVQGPTRTITHRNTGATLKVIAADNETVGGKKATAVLVDELWQFGSRAGAEAMLMEATGGLAARPEGFVVYLSTHADAASAGIFRQKLGYARDVRDGKVNDPRFLPVLYEFPSEMLEAGEHKLKKNWYITNPNLGASVQEEFLEHKFSQAERAGEQSMIVFLAKHLNVEIGRALYSDYWSGALFWEEACDEEVDLEAILERCEVVEIGIDGGGLDDLLGLNVSGRETESKKWLSWSRAWAHRSVLRRYKADEARLLAFAADGDLVIVEELGQDFDEIAELAKKIHAAGLLDKIGLDPAGVGGITDALSEAKIPADKLIGIPQGWKLNGAIKTAERKLADGTLLHAAQPIMEWCVGNAKVEPRGNAVLITKQASGRAKIDPLMAMLNAVSLLALNPKPMRKKYQVFVL